MNLTNIDLGPGVNLIDLRDKPFHLTVELIIGPDGEPLLRAIHAHEMVKNTMRQGFRLRRKTA